MLSWWPAVVVLACLVGGVITAAKGLWLFLFVGLVFGGLIWPLTALFIAKPGSLWARRFYGPETMARARRQWPPKLPSAR